MEEKGKGLPSRGAAVTVGAMPATTRSPTHLIADIEILRAVAVLFTIGQHLPLLLPWTDWAGVTGHFAFWGGVDLFFCISGFVIIRSLKTRDWNGGSKRRIFRSLALPFWVRRIFRILPAAWLWLALPLAGAAWFNRSGAFGPLAANLSDAAAAVLQLANLHWLGCMKYGVGQCNMTTWMLGTYWSLSLEEQFYILLPLALILLPKRIFPLFLGLAILAQLFLARPAWDALWAIRTDSFLLGVALGLWQGRPSHARAEPRFLRRPAIALAMAALAAALLGVIPSPLVATRFSTGLLALLCAGLVFVAGYDRDYLCPTAGWAKRGLLWIGTRSYAIYLIHLPTFYLIQEMWFRSGHPELADGTAKTALFVTSALVLTAIFAEANYRWVETPLRARGKRIAARMAGGVDR